MKPSKNRIFCKDSGRAKMLFETEKKANTFIKFNADDIEECSGYSPKRAYFCVFCNGYHVTSSEQEFFVKKTRTDKLIEGYHKAKEMKQKEGKRLSEVNSQQSYIFKKNIAVIKEKLIDLHNSKEQGNIEKSVELMNESFEILESMKEFKQGKKDMRLLNEKLFLIKQELVNL